MLGNDWLRAATAERITLTLHIQPGAKQTACAGLHGDALKIRLAAPPVDGKANGELIAFLAATLGVSKQDVNIKSGHSSRRKIVEIAHCTAAQARSQLCP